MVSFIYILILFFIILITYQVIINNSTIEGLTTSTVTGTGIAGTAVGTTIGTGTSYTPYDTTTAPTNALTLAIQNAENIEYLYQSIASFQNMNTEIQDLSGNVTTLQNQVNTLVQANQQYTSNMLGTTPPVITGSTASTTSTGSTSSTTSTDTTS